MHAFATENIPPICNLKNQLQIIEAEIIEVSRDVSVQTNVQFHGLGAIHSQMVHVMNKKQINYYSFY